MRFAVGGRTHPLPGIIPFRLVAGITASLLHITGAATWGRRAFTQDAAQLARIHPTGRAHVSNFRVCCPTLSVCGYRWCCSRCPGVRCGVRSRFSWPTHERVDAEHRSES